MRVAKMERRWVTHEVRMTEGADGKPKIEGYAALFETWSDDLGGFREKISQDAFNGRLADDVRALFNHDPNFVLGRTASGSLRLSTDENGLFYEVEPPDTQYARDLVAVMARGDVNQSSFAFFVGDDRWEEVEGAVSRTILQVERLVDVSPVTYPAYPDASSQVRTLAAALPHALDGAARGVIDNLIERLSETRARLAEDGTAVDEVDEMTQERITVYRHRLALAEARLLN